MPLSVSTVKSSKGRTRKTRDRSFPCQFDYLHVTDFAGIKDEFYHGLHLVKSVFACGAGIDTQQLKPFVKLHLKNMGMPANEELWRILSHNVVYGTFIMTRVSPYMPDPYRHLFQNKPLVKRVLSPQNLPVYVAMNCPQGLKGKQLKSNLFRTNVTCMPDLIAFIDVPDEPLIECSMRIRQKGYLSHFRN